MKSMILRGNSNVNHKTQDDAKRSISESDYRLALDRAINELETLFRDKKFIEILKQQNILGKYTIQFKVNDEGRITATSVIKKPAPSLRNEIRFLCHFFLKHSFSFKLPKADIMMFEYTFEIN